MRLPRLVVVVTALLLTVVSLTLHASIVEDLLSGLPLAQCKITSLACSERGDILNVTLHCQEMPHDIPTYCFQVGRDTLYCAITLPRGFYCSATQLNDIVLLVVSEEVKTSFMVKQTSQLYREFSLYPQDRARLAVVREIDFLVPDEVEVYCSILRLVNKVRMGGQSLYIYEPTLRLRTAVRVICGVAESKKIAELTHYFTMTMCSVLTATMAAVLVLVLVTLRRQTV